MSMKADTIKRMSIKEFREFGYLQELNRAFLHPKGLALEVVIDEETGEVSLGGIWDYRDDSEGIIFEDGPDADKAIRVMQDLAKRKPIREEALGFWIQPLKSE